MAGSKRRNSVIVVFMGRQQNASRSSGGLGRNRRWKRGLAYRTTEETDLLHAERGPVDVEGSGVPLNGGNGPPTVETGVLLIGRSVAYRKTEETDLLRSKTVDGEGCGLPQNGGNRPPTVDTGVLLIGRGVAYRKTEEMDLLRSKQGSC